MQNSILNSEIDFGITALKRIVYHALFALKYHITLQTTFHIHFKIQKRV